ncbi:DUF2398 family protein [Rhodococcoides corynebacterioides]|uniref:DUF2398 family protein n=1 Tax=Rhodococcoides corynebacterioides TaxID=53972 RepID=A0ABS7P387_9NOCA|nr:DUF2398 family protein [Rhodococcus corynebacterioides]MBY6366144.1 DUF2398 family protein [Rhodococcus corynebacterioides]MBY6406898.1 DUF2398 family protein [Rhodococcus corynebacterioides]
MRVHSVPDLALDNYQRAVRTVLSHHLITRTYPDRVALPLVRRWATELREDLLDAFGYRLEVTETTARVHPVVDRLDATRPARTAADRVFDRRRYALTALVLAALGRAGDQVTLSELADAVAAEARRVVGIDLDTDRAADRDAFVDAVSWLATRGAITIADGDAGGWARDPDAGEALYDIDPGIVAALFRPARPIQHLGGAAGLLADPPRDAADRARRARRALVERPVVYGASVEENLPDARSIADVALLTGLTAERRAEGVALIDTSGRLSDVRFPSTGTVAQVALLLAGEIADRVLDPDGEPLPRVAVTLDRTADLVAALDTAVPAGGVFETLVDEPDPEVDPDDEPAAPTLHPVVSDAWLDATVDTLVRTYGRTFAAQWTADAAGLRREALALLARLALVAPVDGGVAALPALARYRGVVVTVREHPAATDLFASARTEDLS